MLCHWLYVKNKSFWGAWWRPYWSLGSALAQGGASAPPPTCARFQYRARVVGTRLAPTGGCCAPSTAPCRAADDLSPSLRPSLSLCSLCRLIRPLGALRPRARRCVTAAARSRLGDPIRREGSARWEALTARGYNKRPLRASATCGVRSNTRNKQGQTGGLPGIKWFT